jgi:hypothetical protein
MDISLAIGFALIASAAVWNWYSLYLLEKRIDKIMQNIADLDQDVTDNVCALDYNISKNSRAIDDLTSASGRHSIQLNKLNDVAEAARLKKQNDYLQELVDSGKSYKQQIASNNRTIKELMP